MASPGKAAFAVAAERAGRTAVGLFALGAVAVGVSGLVAEAMGRIWGAGFLAGEGVASFPAERCAALEAEFPGRGCWEAAALQRWDEIVKNRILLGVAGLLALVVFVRTRRWASALPRAVVPGIACLAFAGATVWLGLQAAEAAERGAAGIGAPLSGAIVALLAALGCGAAVMQRVDAGG
jgi:hypothetical protein